MEEWQGLPGLPGEGGEPLGLGRVRGAGRPWPAALVWGSPLMAQVPAPRSLELSAGSSRGSRSLAVVCTRGDCWPSCFSELVRGLLEGLG